MFEGLHSYEKLLAILGIVLFAVLVFALITYVLQRRGIGTLLPFFLVPLVMVGFPGIQKISYENGKLVLERALAKVEQNPNDAAARAQLQASVEKVAPRAGTDPTSNLPLARAYQKLGQPERALEKADSAVRADPRSREALDLQRTLKREVRHQ
jgi:tetratricopeptide (TPR) repeat protein